jgi:hypothetical protein
MSKKQRSCVSGAIGTTSLVRFEQQEVRTVGGRWDASARSERSDHK